MKHCLYFLLGIVISFLAACGSSPTPIRPSKPYNPPPAAANAPAKQPNTGISVGSGGANFSIPYSNETPPSGVLDQLVWAGTGGGTVEQPCGNCSIELSGTSLSLQKFSSSQRLKLLIYRYTGTNECINGTADYVTSLDIQVDNNGRLDANLNGATNDLFVIYAIDMRNGEKVWKSDRAHYTYEKCPQGSSSANSCSGAPAQRVKIGSQVYVCTAKDTVKLREKAGKQYGIIKSLVPGADLKVIGGPKCSDNWSWWQVRTESGYVGWIAEGGDSVDRYFICPR